MKTTESRNIKIDLQIKKRRENIDSPSNNKMKQPLPTTKSTNHSKKLNVTVHHRHEQKTSQYIIPQEQPKKIVISEFKVSQPDISKNLFPKSLNLSRIKAEAENKQNCAPVINAQVKQWWESSQVNQNIQKSQIISQIIKKEAQIQFYEHLLQEKCQQSIQEIWSREKEYEEYIQSLISLYQAQLQKNKQLSKDIQDKQFEKKRQAINLQGKMGLNFSPKQLSTFSGMSGASILLDSGLKYHNRSGALKKRRSEIFSFGSSNKLEKSRSVSKQTQKISFLNPGRAMVSGRRIIFQ